MMIMLTTFSLPFIIFSFVSYFEIEKLHIERKKSYLFIWKWSKLIKLHALKWLFFSVENNVEIVLSIHITLLLFLWNCFRIFLCTRFEIRVVCENDENHVKCNKHRQVGNSLLIFVNVYSMIMNRFNIYCRLRLLSTRH